MIWGKFTWYFFHTLAEKIKEDQFTSNKELLVSIIKDVCGVLPCPTCRSHAVTALKHVNWGSIQTKDHFKQFLFDFHNKINQRKRMKIENIAIIDQYKRANFRIVILKFREAFQTKIPQLMTEQMHRKYMVNKVLQSIISRQEIFMP
tara:strand:+ start:588 stop:1028 length:441 start_codon:yes stop_codon:yes gene_type:complete